MHTLSRPVLALDFDGVLCDGRDEALVTAFNAYNRCRGLSWWIDEPENLDPRLADRFRSLCHLVRSPREYWLILHWLESQPGEPRASDFARLGRHHLERLAPFETVFHDVRRELQDTDAAGWSALHRFCGEAAAGWRDRCEEYEIHLVTERDLDSVRHFNIAWSLGLDDTNLLTRERVGSLPEALVGIAGGLDIDPGEILYVGAHPANLAAALESGVRCRRAGWSYAADGRTTDGVERLERLSDLPSRLSLVAR